MQQETEDLVTRADKFVEENRELVGEAGPETLGRIVTHGAPIAVQLSELVTERSRLAVDAANALTTAIKGQQVTPKEMYKLEVLHKVRLREYERFNNAMSRLISFLEGVSDLLNAPEVERERDPYERRHYFILDMPEEEAEVSGAKASPEKPKSLWRKLFS